MNENYSNRPLPQLLIRDPCFLVSMKNRDGITKCIEDDVYFRPFISNENLFFYLSTVEGIQLGCIKTCIKVPGASSLESLFYGHPRVSKIILKGIYRVQGSLTSTLEPVPILNWGA